MYIHATPLRKKGGDQLCVCVYMCTCVDCILFICGVLLAILNFACSNNKHNLSLDLNLNLNVNLCAMP